MIPPDVRSVLFVRHSQSIITIHIYNTQIGTEQTTITNQLKADTKKNKSINQTINRQSDAEKKAQHEENCLRHFSGSERGRLVENYQRQTTLM